MDLAPSTLWWLLAGGLVAAELATGTFYLLMLALGAAAGALAAHAGAGVSGQFIAAALLGGGAVAVWHRRQALRPASPPPQSNPDLNLDIGQRVLVPAWSADGTTEVSYRGATWQARWQGAGPPDAGEHVIRAIEGTRLVLERSPG